MTATVNRSDIDGLKAACRGRWPEILSRLGGIPAEVLDGRHHPCPRHDCGGMDRFRFTNLNGDGSILCNKCGQGIGDGIGALMWVRGWDFPLAAREVAQFVGYSLGSNASHKPNGKPAAKTANNGDGQDLRCKLLFPATAPEGMADMVSGWCSKKPPITTAAVMAYGGKIALWPAKANPPDRQMVLAFRGRHVGRDDHAAAILLYRLDGGLFPAFKNLSERKTHLVGGSDESWLWPGTSDDLKAAQALLCCEGLTDALAATSAGLPEGMIAVTNACGAKSTKLDYSIGAGKFAFVCGDADKPGQEGADAKAAGFFRAGAQEVRFVPLPYPLAENHGKDLRDFVAEGGSLMELLDKSQVITEADLPPEPDKDGEQGGSFDLGLITATELLRKDCRVEFFIPDILAKGQHHILGGPLKCCKTLTATDMAVSLGSVPLIVKS